MVRAFPRVGLLIAVALIFCCARPVCHAQAVAAVPNASAPPATPPAMAAPAKSDWDKTMANLRNEQIVRQETELKADVIAVRARQEYLAKDYEKARDSYLEAISLLRQIGGSSDVINQKVDNLANALALVYSDWASDLVAQAQGSLEAGSLEKARELCVVAVEMCPAKKGKIDDLLKKIDKAKENINFSNDTAESTLDPQKDERLYKIDVLFEQGKVLFADQKFDKAKDKFEEILVLDPYNLKATRYLRLVNTQLFKTGKARADQTEAERMSELEWKYLTPIISRSISGERVDVSANEPIAKENELDTIQRKLEDIMIDHIEFEEVSIYEVVKYLKQESKRMDPDGKGVNIFLRIEQDAAAPGAPGAPGAEPAGDDDDAAGPASETKAGAKAEAGDDDDDDAAAKSKGKAGAEAGGDDDWGDDDDDNGGSAENAGGEGKSGGQDEYLITIVVDHIPLGEAIDYICKGANLKYRVRKYAVEIASPNVPFGDLETRIYPVEKEAFEEIASAEGETKAAGDESGGTVDVREYFNKRGVDFRVNGSKVVYDPRISRLIATNTPENLGKIEGLIRNFNVVDPQVLIKAKFVEISQTDFDELGFEWQVSRASLKPGQNPETPIFQPNDPINRYADDGPVGNATPDRVFGVNYTNSDNVNFQGTIHALNQNDSADVLSSPRVTTQNGMEASIRMITDVYYPSSWSEAEYSNTSSTSGTSEIQNTIFTPSIPEFDEAKPIGISLTVTPTVDADRYTIDLDMSPVVQDFAGWTDYSYTISDPETGDLPNMLIMPIIEARTVQTSLRVYDGKTIVMGGIISDKTSSVDDRVPIMGDVPLVGRLFRSKIEQNIKTNLLIFVTVRLVNPDGSPLRTRKLDGLPPFKM